MEQIEQRIEGVRNDREHGSRWLVREAVLILRDLARQQGMSQDEQMNQLYIHGRELARLRPAMAALSGAVAHVLAASGSPQAVAEVADQLLVDYDHATEQIVQAARPFLRGQLMTCSISGTVLDVLVSLRDQISGVYVLEGRPGYEGREMAHALQQQGLAVTLLTDAQAAIFLPSCQGVVVGADSVLANGDVLNKAGTALLAWCAHGLHRPLYVLCETLKVSPRHWKPDLKSQLAQLEEKEPEEVWREAPSEIRVRNIYFDHTPFALVTRLLTERGALSLSEIQQQARRVETDEEHLFRDVYSQSRPQK